MVPESVGDVVVVVDDESGVVIVPEPVVPPGVVDGLLVGSVGDVVCPGLVEPGAVLWSVVELPGVVWPGVVYWANAAGAAISVAAARMVLIYITRHPSVDYANGRITGELPRSLAN